MRYMVQALLVLLLVFEPLACYAQAPEAQSAPSESRVSSPSTSQTRQTIENTPAQPATTDSLPSTPQTQQAPDNSTPAAAPQTQQAPDNSTPAAAPLPINTTKAKRKRGHLSGLDIGIIVFGGLLLVILLRG